MDRAERDRLREQIERMVFPGERVRGLDGATVLSLLDALDAAEAERDLARRERDVARAWAKRYREALEMIESGVRSEHEIVDLRWCGAVAGNALTTCDVEERS